MFPTIAVFDMIKKLLTLIHRRVEMGPYYENSGISMAIGIICSIFVIPRVLKYMQPLMRGWVVSLVSSLVGFSIYLICNESANYCKNHQF